jgi:hypothetical protein
MPELPPLDPRATRAALQDAQAAHRPIPDHTEAIREGLARARRPEAVAGLLARAAEKLRASANAMGAADEQ